MCGCAFSSRPATTAARSIIRAKPAVVNADPRSLTKTNGDVSLSRWSRRRTRSSSPRRGWVLGVPFLTRRTCRVPAKQPRKQHNGCCVATNPQQAYSADCDERQIRDHVPEIRYAEQFTLVGELMVALILQQWRKRQQCRQ